MARRLGLSLVLFVLAAPAAGTQQAHAVSNDERIRILQEKIAQAQAQEAALASEIASGETRIRELESEVGGVTTRLVDLEHDWLFTARSWSGSRGS